MLEICLKSVEKPGILTWYLEKKKKIENLMFPDELLKMSLQK